MDYNIRIRRAESYDGLGISIFAHDHSKKQSYEAKPMDLIFEPKKHCFLIGPPAITLKHTQDGMGFLRALLQALIEFGITSDQVREQKEIIDCLKNQIKFLETQLNKTIEKL